MKFFCQICQPSPPSPIRRSPKCQNAGLHGWKLVYQASGQYAKNYLERHGILKVLGMREPVSLESIYTAVQLLSETDIEEILLSEIAAKSFEEDRLFFAKRDVVSQIKTFLAGNLNAPQNLNGEAVLNAIAIRHFQFIYFWRKYAIAVYSFLAILAGIPLF